MKKYLLIIFLILFGVLYSSKYENTFVYPPWGHSWGIHKATDRELHLRFPDMDFKNTEQLSVTRLLETDKPGGSDDLFVTVYGVNSGFGTIIYNTSMFTLGIYGGIGSGVGELKEPHGISGDKHGDVYIADSGNKRVVKLYHDPSDFSGEMPKSILDIPKLLGKNKDPEHIYRLRERGYLGSDWGYPYDVDIDTYRNVYVTDFQKSVVKVFDKDGKELRSIKSSLPTGILVRDDRETWSVLNHQKYNQSYLKVHPNIVPNFIAVIEENGKRISVYTHSGERIETKSVYELGISGAILKYVESDYYLNFLVTDIANSQIHKLTWELDLITSFGERGKRKNQFLYPSGITVYRRYGMIFVAEATGAQYYWISSDVKDLNAKVNKSGIVSTSFTLTEPSYTTIVLSQNKNGRNPVSVFMKDHILYDHKVDLTFDISSLQKSGDINKRKKYYLVVEVNPTYSSKNESKIRREVRVIIP